ncbi:hypothetical protein HJC23_010666 [Cyclotella cryptica]|uniref:Non-structural maintenance of chromosomes element 4 n=1 Tax=Cyclotella cryptica TaxID=29204 RepID=A0ABD3PEJ0_9STRA|eukprot:CCRYP_015173-RB/>CCRYP_015173-RB protein AED:0.04 eAED:0.04 QI:512/1/1/1/0.5/0.33/3/182/413
MAPSKRRAVYDEENIENHFDPMDNHHEDDEDPSHNHHADRRKKKKVKIMSNSGQSDADRRLLRQQQRKLNEDILAGAVDNGDDNESNEEPSFQKMRKMNNKLWDQVRYTREAVLDSENVDLIAANAARQAESLVQVPRYDAIRLAQMLSKKASVRTASGSTHFGWKGFGFQVGICFNSLPSHVSFLYGPLDANMDYRVKERKKPEPRKKQAAENDPEEEEHPEDVDQTQKKESDGNELSAVEAHMNIINKTLKKRSKEEMEAAISREEEYVSKLSQEIGDCDREEKERIIQKKVKHYKAEAQKVNAVQNLFNPRSFTQTVENIFHFSFLVKENKASIEVRDAEKAKELGCGGPGPVIRPLKNNQSEGEVLAPRQAIVSLNMKDWKDMCKVFEVEVSDVPHRGSASSDGKKRRP